MFVTIRAATRVCSRRITTQAALFAAEVVVEKEKILLEKRQRALQKAEARKAKLQELAGAEAPPASA